MEGSNIDRRYSVIETLLFKITDAELETLRSFFTTKEDTQTLKALVSEEWNYRNQEQ